MRRLPKLCESWIEGNTTIEVYEDIRATSSCDLTYYKLRIIVDDSKQFPVLSGAINEAKRILQRKNHRELREIGTEFYLNGKNEKDQ
tara:strand:+ start:363 stop:623 length:261 start_codon:yes stop_codon:yes gene_type:complete